MIIVQLWLKLLLFAIFWCQFTDCKFGFPVNTEPTPTPPGFPHSCPSCAEDFDEDCVGPEEVLDFNSPDASKVFVMMKSEYPDPLLTACIPAGYIVRYEFESYVCFHKPHCKALAKIGMEAHACKACAKSCGCPPAKDKTGKKDRGSHLVCANLLKVTGMACLVLYLSVG